MDIKLHFNKISTNILQVIIASKIRIILSKVLTDIDLAIFAPIGMLDNNTKVHIKLISMMS